MNKLQHIEIHCGTYLVTGATGFIGSGIVKMIMSKEQFKQGHINIICHARDLKKFEQIYTLEERKQLISIFSDIADICKCIDKVKQTKKIARIDYIFHCASNTTSVVMIEKPVETMDGIVIGTKKVLDVARKERIKSMVYLSSMEVYGDIKSTPDDRTTERMLGYIDILKSRSCYPLGKIIAENYCAMYAKEYAVPVKVARLAQVFGGKLMPGENRVFAQFIRAALNSEDIVLKTEGKSMSNSVATKDAVEAIFFILSYGEDGESYNVVNEKNTMSIRAMAELVAKKIAKGKIKVIIDTEGTEKTGYAEDTGLYMSGEKLRQLGFEASIGIEEMYRSMMT